MKIQYVCSYDICLNRSNFIEKNTLFNYTGNGAYANYSYFRENKMTINENSFLIDFFQIISQDELHVLLKLQPSYFQPI